MLNRLNFNSNSNEQGVWVDVKGQGDLMLNESLILGDMQCFNYSVLLGEHNIWP